MMAIMGQVNKEQKEKSKSNMAGPPKTSAISLLLKKMIPGLGEKNHFKST